MHFFSGLIWMHLDFLCRIQQIERQGLRALHTLISTKLDCGEQFGMVDDAPDDGNLDKGGLSRCLSLFIVWLAEPELLILFELDLDLDRGGDELCFDWIEVDMPDLQSRKIVLIYV